MLDLGEQALTGVFPRRREDPVTVGPLRLVWCPESGLLQLAHSFDLGEMYGENYGYRSGLNRSMVEHLTQKVRELERLADLAPGATVLDIGSNDATSLKAYSTPSLKRIGIDPTGAKFRQYYPDDVTLVPDFFSAAAYRGKRRGAGLRRHLHRHVLRPGGSRLPSRARWRACWRRAASGISSRATCPRCCG